MSQHRPDRVRGVTGATPGVWREDWGADRELVDASQSCREQACCIDQLVMPSRLLGPAPSLE
jgi:hypothetical protein